MEANPLRNLNSFNHFFKPIAASKFLEGFRRERIEADVDTPQTCGIQVCRLLGKQDAVCRESDVLDSRNRCEFRHEVMKRPPNQRLTASQTQFFDPRPALLGTVRTREAVVDFRTHGSLGRSSAWS